MLTSKKGQASTYSPNTQTLNRQRMGNLFAAPAPSPLSRETKAKGYTSADTSPTKSRQLGVLGRLGFGMTVQRGASAEDTEDEGCFVLNERGSDAVRAAGRAQGGVPDGTSATTESARGCTLMDLPDEM